MFFHTDIDECIEERDSCTQTCINTVGSYTCSCLTGYGLGRDGRTCDGELKTMKCFAFLDLHAIEINAGFKL